MLSLKNRSKLLQITSTQSSLIFTQSEETTTISSSNQSTLSSKHVVEVETSK